MEEKLHHLTALHRAWLGLIYPRFVVPSRPPSQRSISRDVFQATARGTIPTPFPHGNETAPLEVGTSVRARLFNVEFGGRWGQRCMDMSIGNMDPLELGASKWCSFSSFHRTLAGGGGQDGGQSSGESGRLGAKLERTKESRAEKSETMGNCAGPMMLMMMMMLAQSCAME